MLRSVSIGLAGLLPSACMLLLLLTAIVCAAISESLEAGSVVFVREEILPRKLQALTAA
jgi:hypothetical protein